MVKTLKFFLNFKKEEKCLGVFHQPIGKEEDLLLGQNKEVRNSLKSIESSRALTIRALTML